MSDFIRYKHSSPAGDLLCALVGIRTMWTKTGKKAIIYQGLNVEAEGIPTFKQPYQTEEGNSILMGVEMFEKLKPLIEAQEYIESFEVYKGHEVDLDLDEARMKIFTNQPHGSLHRYLFYAFPEMATSLEHQWLFPDESAKPKTSNFNIDWGEKKYIPVDGFEDRIVINFTDRYRNPLINYFFLKPFQDRLVFAGLKKEYDYFCKRWELDIPLLIVKDFNELALAIKYSKFFMGNASMCFHIAEAMKHPRLLEICPMLPNVIPTGLSAYDAYHESAIQYYFNLLMNKE